MNRLNLLFVALILVCFANSIEAQNNKIDSLNTLLKSSKNDTSKYWFINLIAEEYFNFNPDTAYKQWSALEKELPNKISNTKSTEKRSFQRTLAEVKNSIGAYYYVSGNLDKAIDYWNQSISIRRELKDEYGITLSQLNMGFFYYSIRDLAKAIEYWQKAEIGAEKINNLNLQTSALSSIAGVYSEINELEKSKTIFLKLIDIKLKNKTDENLESNYFNLASVYFYLNDNKNSWYYVKKANQLAFSKNIIQEYCASFFLMGDLFNKEGAKDSALFYYNKSYLLSKEKNLSQLNGEAAISLATFYYEKKDYELALKYALESYNISYKANAPKEISESSKVLSWIYDKKGNLNEAYKYFKKHIALRDSMNSTNKETDLFKKQLEFEVERDKISYQKEQEKKEALIKEEKERQRIILYSISIVLVLVILLAIMLYKNFKQKHKANIELESKNQLIEHQKNIVDEKQKEILDSIQYAKRIQNALLANDELVSKYIPNHFTLFKPKDIVSGDFYWATEHNNKFYLAVCDSTGHGVPGSFMSLLNMGFLSEAIKEKDIENPAEIFDYVRKRLIESISKEGQKDGMDGILIKIDLQKNAKLIEYVAANNEPILISDNQIVELTKDKMPVGKGENMSPFILQTIELKENETLYLYTDGYADQFGGPKGKKFKYKQLNELLLNSSSFDLREQKTILESNFNDWKGNLEQVDDVCIIGLKLS